jgi:hypothetical protein
MSFLIPIPAILNWDEVMAAMSALAKAVDPSARHHSEWAMLPDLKYTVPEVTVREEDVAPDHAEDIDKVHCWMIGVDDASPVVNSAGMVEEMGGGGIENDLTILVWGFFDNQILRTDGLTGQQMALRKASDMQAAFILNPEFDLPPEKSERLVRVTPLKFSPIGDLTEMDTGINVIVAQGSCVARISRDITEAT